MITCSECNAENADDSAHCGQCGNPIQRTGAKKTMLAFALSPEKLQEAAAAAKAARETREETAAEDASASKLKLPKPNETEQKAPLDPFAQTMMLRADDAAQLVTNQPAKSAVTEESSGGGFGSRDTPDQVQAVSTAEEKVPKRPPQTENQYVSEPSGRAATMSHLDEIPAATEENKYKALLLQAGSIFLLLVILVAFTYFMLF
jgi:hypothetical protein